MAKSTKRRKAPNGRLPKQVARSGKNAQNVFADAYGAALKDSGKEEQAVRAAYKALERTHEKSGNQWRKRKPKKGESGAKDKRGRKRKAKEAGSRKPHLSKPHPIVAAKRLGKKGRKRMKKMMKGLRKSDGKAGAAARK